MAVLEREQARQQIRSWQKSGKSIVFTNGCFDILHAGHVDIFSQSKSFGDYLVVGLNSDASVRRLKGEGRPVQPQEDRAYILDALQTIDVVVVFDEDTPAELIDFLLPDVLVKGADYAADEIVGAGTVIANGGRIERVKLRPGRSTSSIINKLSN